MPPAAENWTRYALSVCVSLILMLVAHFLVVSRGFAHETSVTKLEKKVDAVAAQGHPVSKAEFEVLSTNVEHLTTRQHEIYEENKEQQQEILREIRAIRR